MGSWKMGSGLRYCRYWKENCVRVGNNDNNASLTEQKMITPTVAFVQWFDNIPAELRKNLAHVFRVCTTEDASQMAMPCLITSLAGFRAWAD
jgi:hypothetical protein